MIKSQKSKFNPNDFKSIHGRAFCFIDDVKVYAVVSNGAMVWVNGQLVVDAVICFGFHKTGWWFWLILLATGVAELNVYSHRKKQRRVRAFCKA